MRSLAGILLATVVAASLYTGASAITRTYYVAAVEVNWDYAPSGMDQWHNQTLEESADASVFCTRDDIHIGRVYKKAIYRGFTDATFTQEIETPSHMGFLGPVIRAEVGDEVHVVFHNMASRPYSIHPHGVHYEKDSEGAKYADGHDPIGDAIEPNATHTYRWTVPESSGPGPSDGSSVFWSYHSHVSESRDVYAGLFGPLVVYKAGILDANDKPAGIDREYFLFLLVVDENLSWYLEENIQEYCYTPDEVDVEDDDFVESNLMHAINGYVFANLNEMFMCEGENVRWYTWALGTEVDLHSMHWHGHTLLYDGHRTDVIELLPATMRVLDMVPDNVGNWAGHCHVSDHAPSMTIYFQVAPAEQCDAGLEHWLTNQGARAQLY